MEGHPRMITPAPAWLYAACKDDSGEGASHHYHRVLGFDEDGTALVVASNERRLVPADILDNFEGLVDFGPHYNDLTTIIPADGWRVEFTHGDGGTEDMPLAGWGMTGRRHGGAARRHRRRRGEQPHDRRRQVARLPS